MSSSYTNGRIKLSQTQYCLQAYYRRFDYLGFKGLSRKEIQNGSFSPRLTCLFFAISFSPYYCSLYFSSLLKQCSHSYLVTLYLQTTPLCLLALGAGLVTAVDGRIQSIVTVNAREPFKIRVRLDSFSECRIFFSICYRTAGICRVWQQGES